MLPMLIATALVCLQDPAAEGDLVELRGVVLSPADDAAAVVNRASVAATMDFLYDHGFNVVFPVAWHDGLTLWPSAAAKAACGVEVDPKFFDPKFKSRNLLTEIEVESHRVGIEIVPIVDLVTACATKEKTPAAAMIDAKSQAFALDLVTELVRLHEIDGIAFDAHALAGNALDAKGVAAVGDWMATVRAAVDKIDPSIRFVLLDGGSAQAAWMERGSFDLAMPRVAAHEANAWKKSVDALVAEPWCAKDPTRVAPLLVAQEGAWHAGNELVLADIAHDREKHVKGEVLSSFALIGADDAKLGDELESGPYYGVATLPWRKGEAWRTHSDAIPPKAGEGTWEWRTDSSGVLVLEMGGKQKGDASWSLKAGEKGSYDLFAWIAPDADVGKRVVYTTSFAGVGMPPRAIDPTLPRNKGWVYMGTVPMARREQREVLRLIGDESDATKVTTAGPMVAILSRRQKSR